MMDLRGKISDALIEIAILVLVFVVLEPSLKDHTGASVVIVAALALVAVAFIVEKRWLRRAIAVLMMVVAGLVFFAIGANWKRTAGKMAGFPTVRTDAGIDGDTFKRVESPRMAAALDAGANDAAASPISGDSVDESSHGHRVGGTSRHESTGHNVEVREIGVGDNARVHIGDVKTGSADVGIDTFHAGSNADISIGNQGH